MDCIYARTVDCIFAPTTNNASTSLSTLTPPITPIKPIAPALFSPISSVSSTAVQDVNSSDRSPSNASTPPNVVSEEKKKSAGGRKRKAESLEEKEQRQRERILRNRHAAQMSRDKKRRQMADLESQNNILKEENVHLSKRVKAVEEENTILSAKLDDLSARLSEIQSQLAFSSVTEMTKVLLDGVRGSAVSATSENDSLMMTDLKEDRNTREVPAAAHQDEEPLRDVVNPYLSDMDVSTTNAETTITDLLDKKRWLRSVKAVCGCGTSDLKNGPRDWRKYPP
ncbi:9024_t:CDS:2 [Diversispora eburnea]|uniref:9024_t:CDS:1 n=1 Tax=Diversispora eburnea TaxID=1213867 RepID=A0A9N8UZA5_9GLOM|nr:9024_t:CDS:2 [Diversispora eburnea]